jgi:AbiV family abortive infection protein
MSKPKDVAGDDSFYDLTSFGRHLGNYMSILKAKQLAESALQLSNSDDSKDHTIALGLYTLAIEEFGKAIIIKEVSEGDDDDTARYKIPKEIFKGRDAHKLKLNKALEKIPPECQIFTVGTYLPFPSGQARTVKVGKNGPTVRVAPGVEGYVYTKYPTNVNLRMSCFFVDWDETGGEWQYHMKLENIDELQRALTIFKEKLDDYDMVFLSQRKQEEHVRRQQEGKKG